MLLIVLKGVIPYIPYAPWDCDMYMPILIYQEFEPNVGTYSSPM